MEPITFFRFLIIFLTATVTAARRLLPEITAVEPTGKPDFPDFFKPSFPPIPSGEKPKFTWPTIPGGEKPKFTWPTIPKGKYPTGPPIPAFTDLPSFPKPEFVDIPKTGKLTWPPIPAFPLPKDLPQLPEEDPKLPQNPFP
ncbi:hypothetical protein M569_10113 [Genlisea aurea]|uniref:Hydroxyproline-rich glycoprotein family protein n=1 Tax=Genlisea aurea TaxID=192259 RepID=S8CCH9_9LAMI|nr:hypothetical protein M569_10113 [Genlisea aurea]